MGRPQSDLHEILKALAPHVYFLPPEGQKLEYPCIVYMVDDEAREYADNRPFRITDRYQITVMDRDPDSETRKKVRELPMCDFDRAFIADHLHHFVYNLHY